MKESSTLGKTINYQEEFRKQPGPVRLFLFESRFLRSVSKGLVGIRCRERERERNKGSKATLLKLLEKFLVRPTPPLFPSNSRDPTSNEAAPPYDPSAKGIDSCSVLCAITTTLEYKSTGPMETTEPLDQEGGIPMERGLIAEWKNWQQLRYRWLIDSELNP